MRRPSSDGVPQRFAAGARHLSSLLLVGGALCLAASHVAAVRPAAAQEPAPAAGPSTTLGPATPGDPYGRLVPLRVVPKVRVLDPAAGVDLTPAIGGGTAAAAFTHQAWLLPRGFEPARPAAARPVTDAPAPPRTRVAHRPVIVRRSVAATPVRRSAPVRRKAAPAPEERLDASTLPARQWMTAPAPAGAP